ncbi:MAG: tol-pal system protein YbgF [Gammaproteobacteria bacterium]
MLPGKIILALGGAATVLAGCAMGPEVDPMEIRLRDVESRMARIERVLDNQSLLDLSEQVQQQEEDQRRMRGELEELQHALETSGERQRELYLDVDQRLQDLEAGGTTAAGRSGGSLEDSSSGLPLPGGSELANYQAALELLKEGRYEDARSGFQQFLSVYPQSDRADNAQYWFAETYYVTRQFAEALPEFQQVVEQFPRSQKVPDALLKIGFCSYELGRWDEARAALSQVTSEYTDKTAARLAEQRLAQMEREGH